MSTIEPSIELEVPVQTAYNQWTQLEQFPKFMDGVEEIRQLDDRRLHWVASFGGSRHEWDAEITEQLPDERVAWRNTDGKDNAGEGIKEKLGDALGAPDRRVQGDLQPVYLNPCQRGNAYQRWQFWNGGWARNVATGRCLENRRSRSIRSAPGRARSSARSIGGIGGTAGSSAPATRACRARAASPSTDGGSSSTCDDPYHPILPVRWYTELA